VKISNLGVTHYFTEEIDQLLDLVIGTRLHSFNDDHHTDHVTCSRYVELQGFMGFRGHQGEWGNQILHEVIKSLMCFHTPLEFALFLEDLEEREPPNTKL
jgi:hypothetical protein